MVSRDDDFMAVFRCVSPPRVREILIGVVFGLSAHSALNWWRSGEVVACVGGGANGWTVCERAGEVCAPRGLPCRSPGRPGATGVREI